MVTGDHPLTAKAIAKAVGIITSDHVDELKEESAPLQGGEAREHIEATTTNELSNETNKPRADAIVVHGSRLKNFTQEDWDRVHTSLFIRHQK
jgi:sodium/potassium-transporting ATPase subunit alpha